MQSDVSHVNYQFIFGIDFNPHKVDPFSRPSLVLLPATADWPCLPSDHFSSLALHILLLPPGTDERRAATR